jgi:hypothetical protein
MIKMEVTWIEICSVSDHCTTEVNLKHCGELQNIEQHTILHQLLENNREQIYRKKKKKLSGHI